MRSAATLCLAFAASALAYQVTFPTSSEGWTNSGAQTLKWDKVSTDPDNFAVVLTNTDRSVLPINNQVLAAQVDGSSGSTTLNAPSGGWPVGGTFRVNLVQNDTELSTIYAQSDEFNITAVSSTSSGSSTSGSSSTIASTAGTTAIAGTTTASTGAGDASSSSDSASPTTSNGAVPFTVQTGFIGALALVGALLA